MSKSCRGLIGIAALLGVTLEGPVFAAEPFEQGMVTITLDDGWATQYTKARPALNARNMDASYALVTQALAQGWGGYMTTAQVQTLVAEGNDIASHTVSHPNLMTLSPAQLTSELVDSQSWLVNTLGLPAVPNFVVPYGYYDATTLAAIRQTYGSSRTVKGGRNFRDSIVYELRANDVHQRVAVSTVRGWIDQAAAEKSWLILVFHEFIDGTPVRDTQYRTSNFTAILDHIRTSGLPTVTLAQGVAMMEGRTDPDPAAGLPVYVDGMESGFDNWSWATHSLDETGVVHAGSTAIRFEPDAWSGLMFHHSGVDLSQYQSVELWVHGGTTGGQAVQLVLHDGSQWLGAVTLDAALGAPIAAGTWQKVTVPLASLGVTSGTLVDLYFMDASGGDQGTVYLDDITLVPY
ncbi:polysaccharide deacetylase family protein [Pyxidicoccus fallax]|uniref:Polysaccharide deacetylase family protein n=1 Tax=Pyxidicoccus fallax TaxID=394095 RepID=A0A848LQW0_9BACT|nr:polysaccharide deacetylase family protein [Pyxidicoccus fallax]NMO19854.1 polysaccharide deacetylase family protein [Pyxidicoccus fallax]NPC82384.1 polysaccharide deacetylase family protein [Pyxidicoccus fallax]